MKKYEKEIVQAQLDNEKAVLKQLESNYKDALEEIDSKIANLMGRADADMQHVIYQVEYQRALKAQTESILLQLQTNEFETVSDYLTKCYNEGFLGTMYSMQNQGIPLVFPINQEEVVAAIQHETNLTSSLYKAFDTKDLQKKIASEISRGFSTGASFKEVARNVASAANISKNNAARIARTEGHRITEAAAYSAQQKAKDRGADVVKIWDSALDSKTRPSHVKVDGEIRELEEKFSNGLKYPGDPAGSAAEVINCRCRSRTDARWALDATETKMLGDISKMSPEQRKAIADKLGIPVEDIDLYSEQVVPINAKNYADFKRQYNKLWQYEGSELQKTADPAVAKLEQARTGKTSPAKSTAEEAVKFVPAKDIDSAETFAKQSGVKYADYSKLPLETANEMNKALNTLPDDVRPVFVGDSATLEKYWGGKLPRSSKNYYGVTINTYDGIHFGYGKGYDFDTNGYMVGISSSYKTADKITAAKQAVQERYKSKYDGHTWFYNVSGKATPYHEMGHVYANVKGLPDGFEQAAARWAKETKCDMLLKPSEAWAEAWAAYHTGENQLPDYIQKFVENAGKNGNLLKKTFTDYDADGIINKKIEDFKKGLNDGKIKTVLSKQRQSKHIQGTKEFTRYAEELSKSGDHQAYIRDDLTIDKLSELVNGKLGTGTIDVRNDGSIQEFIDCDEVVGYWYDKKSGEYIPTKRAQVKYALGAGNIHVVPVKER